MNMCQAWLAFRAAELSLYLAKWNEGTLTCTATQGAVTRLTCSSS